MSSEATSSTTPLIEVSHLSKRFPIRKGFWNKTVGHVHAVSDVSLSIMAGETLGLVGESGCGKSTLGRCILQLLRPTEGVVSLKGQDLTQLSTGALRPMRQHMQIIFQNPYSSLDPRMNVRDTLLEPLQIHKQYAEGGKKSQLRRVGELMDMVGLPQGAKSRYPHEFSGGQRQRIGIARALALNPDFIVADEPVSALDVSIQAQILNLMDDLKRELNLTYLFIAHNLSVVEFISDRVAVMYLGEIVEVAPVDELYNKPLHPYTQALLSAIPIPDPTAKEAQNNRIVLEGDPPNPANPPSGCRFHTRCPYVTDVCRTDIPQLEEFEPGHWVHCHHAEAILSGSAQTA